MRFLKRIFVTCVAAVAVATLVAAGIVAGFVRDGYGLLLTGHGRVLGEVDGVAVYAHGGYDVRGKYGLEFQCVELGNRVLTLKRGHRNLSRTGDAESYYWQGEEKGLVVYNNGSPVSPEPWDILVFDSGENDGAVGHVAVVTRTDLAAGQVEFIQQNFIQCKIRGLLCQYRWKDSLPLVREEDGWRVQQGDYPQPVAGWTRPKEIP